MAPLGRSTEDWRIDHGPIGMRRLSRMRIGLCDAEASVGHPPPSFHGTSRGGICHGNLQETMALRGCILQGQPRTDLRDGMGSVIRSEEAGDGQPQVHGLSLATTC